jgi:hypothetical protein
MMKFAHELGVRGFDVSMNKHVVNAFRSLKSSYPAAIGIGNPNWRCGIKLGETDLRDIGDVVAKTLFKQKLSATQLREISEMPENRRIRWFGTSEDSTILSDEDVRNIYLDEVAYRKNLDILAGAVEFVLVGTDYADWLIPLNRVDILLRMIEIIREYGLVPISVSHWTSVTIPVLDQMNVAGHWIYLNKLEQLLSQNGAHNAIRTARKPITAFRVLAGTLLLQDMEDAFAYLKRLGIQNVVLGADAEDTYKSKMYKMREVYGLT